MELEELHILQGNIPPCHEGGTVSRVGVGVRGYPEHTAESSCGEYDGFGFEYVYLACCQFENHEAQALAFLYHNIYGMEFIKKGHFVFDTLLVESLQDHMACSVCCITSSPDRGFPEVPRVPPETPLVDLSLWSAVEREAAVFQIIHGLDGFIRQKTGGLLVREVITAFDSVECMPFRIILFHVPEGCAYTTLGCSGMRSNREEFRDNGCSGLLARLQGCVQACPSCSDDHHIVFMDQCAQVLLFFGFYKICFDRIFVKESKD
jgi:hypothetical protein